MDQIRSLDESLARVNLEIEGVLDTIDKAVYDRRAHAFKFLGKAVRSRFTLLLGDALDLERSAAERISAAAEMTHAASLMHDDCIDKAALRRGLPSLNKTLGTNAAILIGDLVISSAFDYSCRISPGAPVDLVRTVRRMTEGALLEENFRYKSLPAEEAERILRLKTGELFRWCALTACHAAGKPGLYEACGTIGSETGLIFQIIDDVLDFEGETGEMGKDALKDIAEGRATLPLMLALGDPRFAGKLAEELERSKTTVQGDLSPALRVAAIVRENGFTAAARALAAKKAEGLEKELSLLPRSPAARSFRDFIHTLPARTR